MNRRSSPTPAAAAAAFRIAMSRWTASGSSTRTSPVHAGTRIALRSRPAAQRSAKSGWASRSARPREAKSESPPKPASRSLTYVP